MLQSHICDLNRADSQNSQRGYGETLLILRYSLIKEFLEHLCQKLRIQKKSLLSIHEDWTQIERFVRSGSELDSRISTRQSSNYQGELSQKMQYLAIFCPSFPRTLAQCRYLLEFNEMPNYIAIPKTHCLTKLHIWKTFAQVYHCLLYTSPSPRDRQKSRMPSSA